MSHEPVSPVRTDEGSGRAEIDAAIAGLDRATRMFSRQIDALSADPRPSSGRMPRQTSTAAPDWHRPAAAEAPIERREPFSGRAGETVGRTAEAGEAPSGRIDPEAAFEAQMREAQRDAEEYLERAKRRADSLVNTMIGAVEREAMEIRDDAERGIRERWRQVEAEASRFLGRAAHVADNMVAERQERISALSDGIVGRAQTLTRGMDDAERVRRQFEGFIRTLSETADQIAQQSSSSAETEITRLSRMQRPRRSAHRRTAAA